MAGRTWNWAGCSDDHRHQGYATEAGNATLDFAWNQLRAPRVISLVRIGNEASDRLAERLGGEHIENIDFYGSNSHVFAYYPPHRERRRAYA
ncbi:GNAT family N-acetyltransferase OS=Rhodanobacter lindaniclasticus OX=75310 GN=B1991_03505 PE=4 SV=1 [Rhodanobacter lindaniclasticus]